MGPKEFQKAPESFWAWESSSTALPKLFSTKDRFRGKQFFHGPGVGWGNGSDSNGGDGGAMGNDGERGR